MAKVKAKTNDASFELPAKRELANRLFFRLYQCANMLHKTGSRAVEAEGLTTQQWAILGALSRQDAQPGMIIGDLAKYLMVSRQNLAGLIGRMERDGHVRIVADSRDRRSRTVTMTLSGRRGWHFRAQPKIRAVLRAGSRGFLHQRHGSHVALFAQDAGCDAAAGSRRTGHGEGRSRGIIVGALSPFAQRPSHIYPPEVGRVKIKTGALPLERPASASRGTTGPV